MASESPINQNVDEFFEKNREVHAGWLKSLHSLAERSFEEQETSNFIYSVLKEHCSSLKVRRGLNDELPTAVVAVHKPRDATRPALLLRADMDGLPVRGTDGTPSPLHPDVHHACGHDGHVTVLLMCAHWLHTFKEFTHRKVVLFFQPAEERGAIAFGGSGARIAVERGELLDTLHPDVQAVYALHSWPGLEIGHFGVGAGPMMGSSAKFVVEFAGRGGHAAMTSEEGGDALLAACTMVTCAQAVIARGTDAFMPAALAFTSIENVNSTATNAIPSQVRVSGTLRTLDPRTKESVLIQLRRHAAGAATMHGCQGNVLFTEGYPVTRNSGDGARVAHIAALRAASGDESRVHTVGLGEGMLKPILCSEDFSILLAKRGGAYVWLGNGTRGPRLHESSYRFDERALPYGGKLFVHLATGRDTGGNRPDRKEFGTD